MAGGQAMTGLVGLLPYCQAHPQWGLSVQTHKVIGIR
jgi:hypothetical protein